MNNRSWTGAAVIFLALTIAGCLPSSCKRTESRELFAADSLSRQLAAITQEDTLTVFGLSYGPDGTPFRYPRSVQFDQSGLVVVGDVESGAVVKLTDEGATVGRVDSTFELPFLAGQHNDTTYVFDAEANALATILGTETTSLIALDAEDLEKNSVRYATVHGRQVYIKVVPEDSAASINLFNFDGQKDGRAVLPGPPWQWAGNLRSGDSLLVSLRGYFPSIDFFDQNLERDSLRLSGFDSPMLARTRSFVLGDSYAPPLLSASAAFAGDHIFVLNMRPGWTRIDVFDKDGKLVRILTRENPSFNKEYFPTDLAVRYDGNNRYMIAVVYVKPDGRLETYEWLK